MMIHVIGKVSRPPVAKVHHLRIWIRVQNASSTGSADGNDRILVFGGLDLSKPSGPGQSHARTCWNILRADRK